MRSYFPSVVLLFTVLIAASDTQAQVFTDRPSGQGYVEHRDTIETDPYPYLLPIWGDKVVKAGYDLPYSGGVGVNYLWQESSILITDLKVGFNNSELFPLDDIIVFNDAISRTSGVNVRPDIWLFPFLNVYGIFAKSNFNTDVDFTIRVPNGPGYEDILTAQTTASFQAVTTGFGITPTMGVGGYWVALDFNMSWTDIPELKDPAQAFVFGPRIGKAIHFKKPERSLAVWVGGFRLSIASSTTGALPLSDLVEFDEANMKIDQAYMRLNDASNNLEDWWSSLTPQEKVQNAGRYAFAQTAIEKGNNLISALDSAVSTIEDFNGQVQSGKAAQG